MYIGNNNIEKLYIGSTEVDKVYLGTDVIYEKEALDTRWSISSDGDTIELISPPVELYSNGTIINREVNQCQLSGFILQGDNQSVSGTVDNVSVELASASRSSILHPVRSSTSSASTETFALWSGEDERGDSGYIVTDDSGKVVKIIEDYNESYDTFTPIMPVPTISSDGNTLTIPAGDYDPSRTCLYPQTLASDISGTFTSYPDYMSFYRVGSSRFTTYSSMSSGGSSISDICNYIGVRGASSIYIGAYYQYYAAYGESRQIIPTGNYSSLSNDFIDYTPFMDSSGISHWTIRNGASYSGSPSVTCSSDWYIESKYIFDLDKIEDGFIYTFDTQDTSMNITIHYNDGTTSSLGTYKYSFTKSDLANVDYITAYTNYYAGQSYYLGQYGMSLYNMISKSPVGNYSIPITEYYYSGSYNLGQGSFIGYYANIDSSTYKILSITQEPMYIIYNPGGY